MRLNVSERLIDLYKHRFVTEDCDEQFISSSSILFIHKTVS